MKLTRLDRDAFNLAASNTRMGHRALLMARAVLVDGRTQSDVANEFGITKQRVGLAVGAIKRAYNMIPPRANSTIRIEIDLPETLALELGALTDALKGCNDEMKSVEAINKVVDSFRKAAKFLSVS